MLSSNRKMPFSPTLAVNAMAIGLFLSWRFHKVLTCEMSKSEDNSRYALSSEDGLTERVSSVQERSRSWAATIRVSGMELLVRGSVLCIQRINNANCVAAKLAATTCWYGLAFLKLMQMFWRLLTNLLIRIGLYRVRIPLFRRYLIRNGDAIKIMLAGRMLSMLCSNNNVKSKPSRHPAPTAGPKTLSAAGEQCEAIGLFLSQSTIQSILSLELWHLN